MRFFLMIALISIQGLLTLPAIAEKEVPDYAKWGNIAVQETIKKYPSADVVDYLHLGREDVNENIAMEKFKLWLREDEKEFGVLVKVQFDKKTNQFKEISFEETDR